MGDKSKIEWTDATWNPIRGCSRVSEGCRNCYAERVAGRFSGPGQPYEGLARNYRQTNFDPKARLLTKADPRWTGEVRLIEERLSDPLRWKKPRRVFVNSMSDLFHEKVADEWIDRIFAVMALTRRHTYQILTKRPERMLRYCGSTDAMYRQIEINRKLLTGTGARINVRLGEVDDGLDGFRHSNVWLGVSVEDQKTADERIPLLLQTPAQVRFISYEPALGPVDLRAVWNHCPEHDFSGGFCTERRHAGVNWLDWVICGGESGPGARPMHPDWACGVRDQCQAASVPFFFKQWGEWLPGDGDGTSRAKWQDGNTGIHPSARNLTTHCDYPRYHKWGPLGEPGAFALRVGKKAAGRLLDGREWNEYPASQEKKCSDIR